MQKRIGLFGLGLVTVMATTCLAGQGYAKSASFSPESKWAVTRIDQNENAQNPYCALARRYTEKMILTVARNENYESALAVDFQKPALNPDQSYVVTLDPGAGQARAFKISPVSDRAFVIRLGEDDKFFSALKQSERLDIDMQGDRYSFDVTDIGGSEERLSTCVTELIGVGRVAEDKKTPSEDGPSATALNDAPASSKDEAMDITADITTPQADDLISEIKSARADAQRPSPADRAPALPAEKPAKVKEAKQPSVPAVAVAPVKKEVVVAEDDTALKDMRREIARLQEQNGKLEAELEIVRSSESGRAELDRKLADLTRARVEGEKAIQEKTAALEALRQEQAALRKELAGLKLAAADAQTLKGKVADAENLKTEADSLRRQLAEIPALKQEVTALKAGKAELELQAGRLKQLEDENAALKKIADSAATIQQANGTLEEKTAQLEKLSREKAALEIALAAAKTDAARQGKAEADLTALRQQADQYKARIAELEAQQAAGSAAKEKIAGMAEEIERLKAANAARAGVETEVGELKRQLAEASKKLNETAALETENRDLKQQVAAMVSLQKKNDELMKTAASSRNDEAEALQKKLETVTQEFDRQREQYQQKIARLDADLKNSAAAQQSAEAAASALDAIAPAAGKAVRPPVAAPALSQAALKPAAGEQTAVLTPVSLPPAAKAPVGAEPARQAAVTAADADSIRRLLTAASIPVQEGVQRVRGKDAFRWKAGSLYGSAEQRLFGSGQNFDQFVTEYLDKIKSRCKGDFAAIPETASQSGGTRVAAFEIACVTKQGNSSAALLFYNDAGRFTTIAHETDTENMDVAMDARDRMARTLLNGAGR